MYIAGIVLLVLGLLGMLLAGCYWLWIFPLIDDKKREQITGGKVGSPYERQYRQYRQRTKWRLRICAVVSVVLSLLGLFFWL